MDQSRGVLRFWTENSLYEVDFSRSLIRRLGGRSRATPHQGPDGRWQQFVEISPVEVDEPVLVHWETDDGSAASNPKRTQTSHVVGVSTGETGSVPDWVHHLLERGT
jgi:hypothetical protein